MKLPVSLLLASGLLAGVAQAQGQNPSFNLLNRGNAPIRELYVTPSGDANWGRNRLGRGPIAPGSSFAVRRHVDGNCIFDIRVVFADGRSEQRRALNTCTADDIAIGGGAAGAAAGTTVGKAKDDPSFRLINRGTQSIDALYATPAGLGNWGENRLGTASLAPQTDRVINVPRQPSAACQFDVKVVFADRKALEKHNANLCRINDLPVP